METVFSFMGGAIVAVGIIASDATTICVGAMFIVAGFLMVTLS